MRLGCLSLLAALVLMLMLPVLFADVLSTALLKLGLPGHLAGLVVAGVLIGSLLNVPVRRIERPGWVPDRLGVYGLTGFWLESQRLRTETTIVALNVGGCLVPASLAVYEATLSVRHGAGVALLAATVLNVAVCYRVARPVPGVGVLMPGLIPPALAAASALLLAPEIAPPVAFVAGTLGPLVGADLLHLRRVEEMETGIVSIGGAGTFDGIVLSGIVALYLA
jgi:uncharacterized membrane protein